MKRFTHLFTILIMLSLGMGLSQALHHAVAHHVPTASSGSCGGTSCGSVHAPNQPRTNDDSKPAAPAHDPSDCAVCLTIAGTKTLISSPVVSVIDTAPVIEHIALPEACAPRIEPLRVLRGRAPPTT